MAPEDVETLIRERVSVTPQRVVLAKAIVLDASIESRESELLIQAALNANEVQMPGQVVVHPSVDPMPQISAAAEALSWRLAASEAIWSLIHSGLLVALSEPHHPTLSISWTTVVPGSGGMSGGWRFDDLVIPLPRLVRRAPSLEGAANQFLSEPDLYLNTLGVSNMHPDVTEAFREAVKCFRHELFTASVTMLGKASEGAWLELGASLLAVIPVRQGAQFTKQRTILEDPATGPLKKVEAILQIYSRQDVFQSLASRSSIRIQELRHVAIWSDAVRDSRNTIHFGVASATPNTYEKLVALLISAVPNVRQLYRLKAAADADGAVTTT
jgi:hypothetical protein